MISARSRLILNHIWSVQNALADFTSKGQNSTPPNSTTNSLIYLLKNVSYHLQIMCVCASPQIEKHVASRKKTKLIIVRTLSRKKVSLALWRARRAHCLKGSQQSLHCRHATLIAESCTSIKHQSLHTYSTLKLKHTITLFLIRIQKTYQLGIPIDLH